MNVEVMDTQTGGEGETIQVGNYPHKKAEYPKNIKNTPIEEQTTMQSAIDVNRQQQPTEVAPEQPAPEQKVPNAEYWNKIYDWVTKNPKTKTSLGFDDFVNLYSSDPVRMSKLYSTIQKTSVDYPRNFNIGSYDDFQNFAMQSAKIPTSKELVDAMIKKSPENETFVPALSERAAKPINAYSTTLMAVNNLQKSTAGENVNDVALAASMQKMDGASSKMKNPFYEDENKNYKGFGSGLVDKIKTDTAKNDEMNQVDNILLKNELGEDISYTTGKERERMYDGQNFDPSSLWGVNKEVEVSVRDKQHDMEDDVKYFQESFDALDAIVKNQDWKKGAEIVFALEGIPKGMTTAQMKAEVMDEYNFFKKQLDLSVARLDNHEGKKTDTRGELPDDIEDSDLFKEVKSFWEASKNKDDRNSVSYERAKSNLINNGYWNGSKYVKASTEDIDAIENYLIGQDDKSERGSKYWKDPSYVTSYKGYYEMLDTRQKQMERGVSSYVNSLNSTIKTEAEKKVSDMSAKIQEDYNRDIEFYSNKIKENFAKSYEQAFLSSPEAIELRKYYVSAITNAKTQEDKLALEAQYNDKLSQLPVFSDIAKEQNKAVNEINIALKAKYDERVSNENRKISDYAHEKYFSNLRNYIQNNFSFGINNDKGALEYIHQHVSSDASFNMSSYGDKKKMLKKAWQDYKTVLVKDLYSNYVKVPVNEKEESLPWYQWTGKRAKTQAEKKLDMSSIGKRTGAQAEREFYFYAMDKVMFSDKKLSPTVYQVKSYAEQYVEDINQELTRITGEIDKIKKGMGADAEFSFGRNMRKMSGGYTQDELEKMKDPSSNSNVILRLIDKQTKLELAKDKFNEILNHKEGDDGWFKDLWDGMSGGKFYEYMPFVSSVFDISHGYSAYKASRKVQDGKPLSFIEKSALESMAGLKQIEDLKTSSNGTVIGTAIKDMLPFIGEFAFTLGSYSVGAKAGKGIVKTVLKSKISSEMKTDVGQKVARGIIGEATGEAMLKEATSSKAIDEMFEKGIAKHFSSGLELVLGSVAHTMGNPQMVYKNYLDRMTPEVQLFLGGNAEDIHALVESKSKNKSFSEGFGEAFGLSWAELFSEQLGGYLFKMPKGVVSKVMNDTGWLQRSVLGGWYRAHKFVSKSQAIQYILKNDMGWHGVLNEYAEEFVNGRLGALITGDRDVWDIDSKEEMNNFLVSAVFGTGVGILHTAPKVVKSTLTKNNDIELTLERTNYETKKPEISSIKINKQAWKKFNSEILGSKGVNINKLNSFLEYGDNFTDAQKEVLTGIYQQVKAKDIKSTPAYAQAKSEIETDSDVKIADNWGSNEKVEIPEVEGEDFDETVIPEEDSSPRKVVLPHSEFIDEAVKNGHTRSAAKRLTSGFTDAEGNIVLSDKYASEESPSNTPNIDKPVEIQLGDKQIEKDATTNLPVETEVVDVNGDDVHVRNNRTEEVSVKNRDEYSKSKSNSTDKSNVSSINFGIRENNEAPEVVTVPWNKVDYQVTFDDSGNIFDIRHPNGTKGNISKSSITGFTARANKIRNSKTPSKNVEHIKSQEESTIAPLSPVEEKELNLLDQKQEDFANEGADLPVADQQRLFELYQRKAGVSPQEVKPIKTKNVNKPVNVSTSKQSARGGNESVSNTGQEEKGGGSNEATPVEKKSSQKTKIEKPNAVQKSSTKSVDVRQQAGNGKGVGKQNAKGETTEKSSTQKKKEEKVVSKKKSNAPSTSFTKMKSTLDNVYSGDENSLKGTHIGKATMIGDKYFGEVLKDAYAKKEITQDEYDYLYAKHQEILGIWRDLNPNGVKVIHGTGTRKKPNLQVASGTGTLNAFLGNIVKRLGKAFPNIKVVTQWDEFLKAAMDFGYTSQEANDIFGMYDNGVVYLNPKRATANTAIEEFGHLWVKIAKEVSPAVYNRGIQLATETAYYTDIKNNPAYDHLTNEEKAEEALAKAVADRGQAILEKENKNLYQSFRTWLRNFWNSIKSSMGIKPSFNLSTTTLDGFANSVAKELLNEFPISNLSDKDMEQIMKKQVAPRINISNSILAKRNRFDNFNSWKSFWFDESKGAGKAITQMMGQLKGKIDRRIKDAEYTLKNFNDALAEWAYNEPDKAKRKAMTEKALSAVDEYLKDAGGASLFKIPAELRGVAQSMRESVDNLQHELRTALSDWGIMSPELEATFNKNMGIWVNRSYMMHDVPSYGKIYKDILTPQQLAKVENFIRDQYETGVITGMKWETLKDGSKTVTFTNVNGLDSQSYNSSEYDLENIIKSAISVDADKVIDVFNKLDSHDLLLDNPSSQQNIVSFRLSSNEIEGIMDDIVSNGNEKAGLIGSSIISSVGANSFEQSVLKKRGDIEPAIRMLMGEYLDPRINFMKSVVKLSQLIEKGKIEHELKLQGEGSLFRKSEKIPEGGESSILSKQISASESYLLKGYWTTPEIHNALFKKHTSRDAGIIQVLSILNGIAKASLTVLKDDSQSRNFWGAALNMMATGHLPTGLIHATMTATNDFTGGQKAASVMSTPLFISMMAGEAWLSMNGDKKASKDLFKQSFLDAVKYNLIEQSVQAGALKEMADKLYTDVVVGSVFTRAKIKTAKGYKTFMETFSKPYQASDAIFKIIQWEKEKKALSNAYKWKVDSGQMTRDEFNEYINSKAAELVRSEQPTYSKSAEAMRWISRMPLFGSFVMFQSQMWKTRRALIRNIQDMLKEANEATDVNQKKVLRHMASKRVAGLVFSMSFTPVLALASMYAMGISGDDDDAISQMFPSYGENALRLYLSPDKKNPVYLDLSFIDPSSQFQKMVVALIRGDDANEKISGFLKEGVEPFISQEIAFQRLAEIFNNKDQYGRPITNPQDYWTQKWTDRLGHVSEVLIPGFLNSAAKIYKGAIGYKNDAGYQYHLWQEIMNSRLGVKAKDRDMSRAYRSMSRTYWAGMEESKKIFTDIRDSKEYSDKEKQEAYFRSYVAAKSNFDKLYKKYEAMKKLDFSDAEINKALDEAKVPKYIISQIKTNTFKGIDFETGKWIGSSMGGDRRSGSSFNVSDMNLQLKLNLNF